MKQSFVLVAAMSLLVSAASIHPGSPPVPAKAAAGSDTNKPKEQPATRPTKGKEHLPVKESAWTWGYFFATPDKTSVQKLFAQHKPKLSVYRVERVGAVRGEPGVDLKPGSTIIRAETAARLAEMGDQKLPTLLFHGLPQHLQYTSKAQRDDLNQRSRTDLPPSKDTVAVIIPIRKSATWWALPHDERQAYFQQKGDKLGHTAIGAKYVDRIYRKLYHTRYAVETRDHDFVTYFEFMRVHTEDFQRLLEQLREPGQNPEWNYVDREYEIWMTKVE